MTVVRLNYFKLLMIWKITINYTGEVMEIQEANKIISEYMGWTRKNARIYDENGKQRNYFLDYHKSLDALAPVWERFLKGTTMEFRFSNITKTWYFGLRFLGYDSENKTIQEAACIATAKAIEALK